MPPPYKAKNDRTGLFTAFTARTTSVFLAFIQTPRSPQGEGFRETLPEIMSMF